MIYKVSLDELGECFYAWINLLFNKGKIYFADKNKKFPFPLPPDSSFFTDDSNKSRSSRRDINKQLENINILPSGITTS